VLPGDGALVGNRWRIYNVSSPMPVFEPASWRLRIDGLVAAPRELTYDELRALPRAEQISDFHCVTGWSVEDVRWSGVRLDDLLRPARLLPEAGALVFHSAEQPYLDSLTLEQASLPDVMLALDMDGDPLSRPHGAPTRLVIPQMYGYKGVKWVERIEAVERPVAGFWEQRGWDWDAWVGRSNGA
jgi:DMSO/TMAO reductase YedYZ molybdopterin-dependent catalytic subunit